MSACQKNETATPTPTPNIQENQINIDTEANQNSQNPINNININQRNQDCPEICENAIIKCPSLTQKDCLEQCKNATNIEKTCLKNFQTCNELTLKCRQPSPNTQTQENNDNNCVSACNNYVLQCISLVPNSSEALKKDAYNSCMTECKQWAKTKINCMSIAPSCEAFTEKCGL